MTTRDLSPYPRPANISPEEWDTRVNLAALYRAAAMYGWTDLIYNHISACVPGEDGHFLLNPFGWMFDEVTASSLVKVDITGKIVAPTTHVIHPAGFVIHSAIHAARPDAKFVMHNHTRAGMAVSAMECGLLPLTQHAMLFDGKVGYHGSEGLALNVDERERLAQSIGDKPVLILRNHGTLIAARTAGETLSLMWHLERAMQVQVDALASQTKLTQPGNDVIRFTAENGFTDKKMPVYADGLSPMGRLEWPAVLRKLDRLDPSFRT